MSTGTYDEMAPDAPVNHVIGREATRVFRHTFDAACIECGRPTRWREPGGYRPICGPRCFRLGVKRYRARRRKLGLAV